MGPAGAKRQSRRISHWHPRKSKRLHRTKEPKYQQGEGGAFGNWEPLQKCIASPRTYPKFAPTQPNLLIIADDLKISLQDSLAHVDIALYADHDRYGQKGYFTSSQYQN